MIRQPILVVGGRLPPGAPPARHGGSAGIVPAVKALLALTALLLFQVEPLAPAAEVLVPDPPAADWIEILDLRLDRDTAADLGVGDVSEFDDVDAHVRAWSGPDGGVVVAIAVAAPNRQFLEGFLSGARESAAARGDSLNPFEGLPDVERYAVVDEGVPVEATVFAAGSYGFSIQGTEGEATALIEDLVRRQLARTPADPPPEAEGESSAFQLGRAVGGALGLAAVGTAAWWWFTRSRRRERTEP